MGRHVTHDQAFRALCDPAVPVSKALDLFRRAHRRSDAINRDFVLHMAGCIRLELMRRHRRERRKALTRPRRPAKA